MSKPYQRLALTGATGFVGQAVLDEALAAGYEVTALTRRPQPPRDGVTWVRGDLEDTESLAELTRGVDAVIHVAGVVNAPDAASFERGNVAGTLNLVDVARLKGIHRFVLVSSLSAREPELSLYGASKLRGEKVVRASALDWTIVRPPAVYGPHDREIFELFRVAKWGIVPVPAVGRASFIHVSDLARLLVALVPGGDMVTSRTFEPDDGTPLGWSHREMALEIGRAVGRRVRVLGLSRQMLDWVAWLDTRLRGKKAKMTADRAAYYCHPDWVSSTERQVPTRIWTPQIQTRFGLAATARWYKERKWL